MKHQKIINLLDHTVNQPSKFRTGIWLLKNHASRAAYNNNEMKKIIMKIWIIILLNSKTSIIITNL